MFDGAGNLAEDSVLVQVVPTWSEILASGWGLVLASVVVIGFVAVSWKWKRKGMQAQTTSTPPAYFS